MKNRINNLASNRPASFVEALEGRRLLSASALGSAAVANGDLCVTGTRGDDAIWVYVDEFDASGVAMVHVTLNDAPIGSFPLADVNRVVVRAGKGNDLVMAQTSLPVVALGEAGDDTLLGGTANDWLLGGRGNDTIYASDGNDWLFGDAGDDVLSGDFGNDVLAGGQGIDQLYGFEGDDLLHGGACDDFLDGGDGDDIVRGGRGLDQLTGGLGADRFGARDDASEVLDKTDEDVHKPAKRGEDEEPQFVLKLARAR
jgi:Ca2+-binding RTX toxin-like protein